MNIIKITFAAASLMLGTAALAGDDMQMKIKIAVDDNSGSGGTHFELNSDAMGFELHDMQVGEVQSIVDDSGRSILITREADGFKIDVDGKTIDLPLFEGKHKAMWVDHDSDMEFDVNVMHGGEFMGHGGLDGVTIISRQEIDEVTRETIKSLLMSTGHESDVNFIDGSSGTHKAFVIKKEVIVSK